MYRLVQFGNISLNYYNQIDDVSSGETPTHYINLPEGGALDGFGNLARHPGSVERRKSIRLQSDTEEDLSALFFELLAMRGKRDRLVRRLFDNTEHWQYARLVAVHASRDYNQTKYKRIQNIELQFASGEVHWRGEVQEAEFWYLNDGKLLNDGLNLNEWVGLLFEIEDGANDCGVTIWDDKPGRAPVRSIEMTIVAGNAAITALSIVRTDGETLTFTGSIAAGKALVIDTGLMRVTNDGVAAYDDFDAQMSEYAAWFALLPGQNEITVTIEGGGAGATIAFKFEEVWY